MGGYQERPSGNGSDHAGDDDALLRRHPTRGREPLSRKGCASIGRLALNGLGKFTQLFKRRGFHDFRQIEFKRGTGLSRTPIPSGLEPFKRGHHSVMRGV